jgi:GTPase SAR1 family protein
MNNPNESSKNKKRITISVLGDAYAGKSALVSKYISDIFDEGIKKKNEIKYHFINYHH